jgi:hypothetical protein
VREENMRITPTALASTLAMLLITGTAARLSGMGAGSEPEQRPPAAPRSLRIASGSGPVTPPGPATQTVHAFFDYQVDSRAACAGSSGINCIVQVAKCVLSVPGDNGGCSLRNQAQLQSLSNGEHDPIEGWNYLWPRSDSYPYAGGPQDAARLLIEAGDVDPNISQQLYLDFPAASGGSLTLVWEEWRGQEWKPNRCGGSLGSALGDGGIPVSVYNSKSWRLDTNLRGVAAVFLNPKANFNVLRDGTSVYPCSGNEVQLLVGGLSGNTSKSVIADSLVSPASIGQTGGDEHVTPSGKGGWVDSRGNYIYYPTLANTWTRHVMHVDWDVPGNSRMFTDWRTDCDARGVNTDKDRVCANMLQTLGAVDSDCRTEGAPNCDSKWARISYWVCDTRGCVRRFYGVPWHNIAQAKRWMVEYDSSQQRCVDCQDRFIYTRNHFFVRNISQADIDDTGCPLNCPGDRGAVNGNVFRKP